MRIKIEGEASRAAMAAIQIRRAVAELTAASGHLHDARMLAHDAGVKTLDIGALKTVRAALELLERIDTRSTVNASKSQVKRIDSQTRRDNG